MVKNKIRYLLILITCLGVSLTGCATESLTKATYIPNKRIEMSPTMQQVIFNLVQTKVKLENETKPIF